MKKSLFSRGVLLLLLFMGAVIQTHAQLNTEIPVNYDVNANGAFTYSLPIRIPPGIKNMVPELAINYNSQGGNGILGMGWSVSGVSSISRSQPTLYHNSDLDQIRFDATSVYAMDGQPLYKETSGAHAGKYMTWIKNYAEIEPVGTIGNGPEYWRVKTTDGKTLIYGRSVSTKLDYIATSSNDKLVWMIDTIYDQYSNYIAFTYHYSPTAGVCRLGQILYGGNLDQSISPTTTVTINYITRSDANHSWVVGAKKTDYAIVDNIEIKEGSTLLNKYEFTYAIDDYSHLTKIEEKRTNSSGTYSLPPININWGSGTPSTQAVEISTGVVNSGTSDISTGDFNGDGFTDYASYVIGATSGIIDVYINNKNNTFTKSVCSTGYGGSSFYPTNSNSRFIVDYNGDGFDDLIVVKRTYNITMGCLSTLEVFCHLSDGTTLLPETNIFVYDDTHDGPSNCVSDIWVGGTKIVPGDFDGDGKTELFVCIPANYIGGTGIDEYYTYLLDSDRPVSSTILPGSTFQTIWGNYMYVGNIVHDIKNINVLDFNGDGKTDVVVTAKATGIPLKVYTIAFNYNNSGNQIAMSSGKDLDPNVFVFTALLQLTQTPYDGLIYDYLYTGDFNGDGYDDILGSVATSGLWQLLYSQAGDGLTIGGFNPQNLPTSMLDASDIARIGSTAYDFGLSISDFNGDGKSDILKLEKNPSNGKVTYTAHYSLGFDNTSTATPMPAKFKTETEVDKFDYIGAADYYTSVGDFNGDGQFDVFSHWHGSTSHTPYIAYFHPNEDKHLVTSIEHAGRTLSIHTKPMTQSAKYKTSSIAGLAYPYIRRTVPIKIVESLNDDRDLSLDYTYENFIINKVGLGLLGFNKMQIKDNAAHHIAYNKYSNTSDIQSPTPFLSSWELWTEAAFNDHYNLGLAISLPFHTWMNEGNQTMSNNNGGCSGRVRILTNNYSENFELRKGIYKTTTKFYNFNPGGAGYEFGMPDSIIQEDGPYTTATKYHYNTSAIFPASARVASMTSTATRSGSPSISKTTDYQHNTFGQVTSETTYPSTPNAVTTNYQYDIWGHINYESRTVSGTGFSGTIANSYYYGTNGKFVTYLQNEAGDSYYSTFDVWGNLTAEANPTCSLGRVHEYDAINRLKKTTTTVDLSGNTVVLNYTYGSAISHPDAPTFQDARYYTESSVSGISSNSITFFDYYNRKIRTVDVGFNNQKIYHDILYSADGLVSDESSDYDPANPSGLSYNMMSYDGWQREITRQNSVTGKNVITQYDFLMSTPGLEITTEDMITHQKKIITNDETGKPVRVNDNDNIIDYTYNSTGQVLTEVMSNTSSSKTYTRTFQYDAYGRLLHSTEPNVGTTDYNYNVLGWKIYEKDALNNTFDYTYDKAGRVKRKTMYDATTSTSYQTDYKYITTPPFLAGVIIANAGKLYEVSSSNGTKVSYSHDLMGNNTYIKEEVGSSSYETYYEYDKFARLIKQTYPNRDEVSRVYKSNGFLESLSLTASPGGIPTQKLWSLESKNEFGQTTLSKYYNASSSALYDFEKTYTNIGLPDSRIIKKTGTTTELMNFWYEVDPYTGNLIRRMDNTRSLDETFQYDMKFDRLINANSNGSGGINHSFAYDYAGNILKKTDAVDNPSYNWKYNDYQLEAIPLAVPPSTTPLPTSIPTTPTPLMDQVLTHYPFKKVKTLEENNNRNEFQYWPSEQRAIMTSVNATSNALISTRYYLNQEEVTVDASTGNVETLNYVIADGDIVAILKHKTSTTPSIVFPMTDNLGSITHILDNVGTTNNGLIEERSFDAWGRYRDPNTHAYLTSVPTWSIDKGYTGHEHLNSKNIINMNGRLYDPLVGRMLSADPVLADAGNSQSYNKYSYVNNNPLKFTDPSGNIGVLAFGYAFYSVVKMGFTYGQRNSGSTGIDLGTMIAGRLFGSAIGGPLGAFASGYISAAGSNMLSGGTNFIGQGARGGVQSLISWGIDQGLNKADNFIYKTALNYRINRSVNNYVLKMEGSTNVGSPGPVTYDENSIQSAIAVIQEVRDMYETIKADGGYDILWTDVKDCPDLRTSGQKPEVIHGITKPKNGRYDVSGTPITYLNKGTITGAYQLVSTVIHEVVHGWDIYSGNLAGWYKTAMFEFGSSNPLHYAVLFSELHAYHYSLGYLRDNRAEKGVEDLYLLDAKMRNSYAGELTNRAPNWWMGLYGGFGHY